jgi:hypothetical protein
MRAKRHSVKRFSGPELARVGITIKSRKPLFLACRRCDSTWSPNLQAGGKLPRGYWKCPKGCNA